MTGGKGSRPVISPKGLSTFSALKLKVRRGGGFLCHCQAIVFVFVFFGDTSSAFNTEDHLKILTSSRWKKNRAKVGVVLSGGAARGLAHVGVMKCWQENNLPLDLIVGTSVGSLVGVLYASGIENSQSHQCHIK